MSQKTPPMFNFEKLEFWQKAIDFAETIYRITAHRPANERYGLTSRMRSATTSIASNIAEGSYRSSKTEFSRFIEIATGSVFEVVSKGHLCRRLHYLQGEHFDQIIEPAEQLGRIFSGLRHYLLRDQR